MSNVSKKEIIVLGIIEHNDRFLVGHVRKEKLEDFGGLEFVFPGGTVEEGESPEFAVIRELEEETGLQLVLKNKLASRIHPVTGKETHYFYLVSENSKAEIIPELNDDFDKYYWFSRKEVIEKMPTINPLVKDFLS